MEIKLFKYVSWGEGISYLLLLVVAMPLKYGYDIPEAVKYVGWVHGLLFMLYVVLITWIAFKFKWNLLKYIIGLVASLVPLGPFLFDKYFLNKKQDLKVKNSASNKTQ